MGTLCEDACRGDIATGLLIMTTSAGEESGKTETFKELRC